MKTTSRNASRLQHPSSFWRGWLPIVVLPASPLFLPDETPRWVVMWVLAFAIFVGCKWLTWRRTRTNDVPYWKHLGYLLAWPGLDAAAFLNNSGIKSPTKREWAFACFKLWTGLVIVYFVAGIDPSPASYWIGWLGMIGLMLCLHFGLFHVLSCFWRSLGVDAKPLMNWPLSSPSVSDFWGKRWNTAFRDLTHRFLFRPLTRRFGGKTAMFFGFVFSGLIHDAVISWPSGGGYGGPTIFFLIQGLALIVERSRLGARFGLGTGIIGWSFTAIVLIGPAMLLLHRPFVVDVIVPFITAIGGVIR